MVRKSFLISFWPGKMINTLFRKFSGQDRIDPRVIQLNTVFLAISVLVLIFLREYIVLYLFSDKYSPTIDIIIPLALAFGFSGMSKPYALYLMAQKWGKTVRNISVTVSAIYICAGLLIIPVYGISGAAWLASVVYLLDLILFIVSYYRIIKRGRAVPAWMCIFCKSFNFEINCFIHSQKVF